MMKPSKVSFFRSATSLAVATAATRSAIKEVFMMYDVKRKCRKCAR